MRKINNIYVGSSGDGHVASIFYAYLEKYSIEDITTSLELIEYFSEFSMYVKEIVKEDENKVNPISLCQFILVIKDKIWIFSDFFVRELKEDENYAIGSGTKVAMACMNLTTSTKKILEAVSEVDLYCSKPFNIIEIKK